jgi:hypothetical protein
MHDEFQYGLKNGKLVDVKDVESGLNCGCVCPACWQPFVAYKGQVLKPHFKHKAASSCTYSFESALHYMAKEIVAEKKYLDLPDIEEVLPFQFAAYYANENFIPFNSKYTRVRFDKVEVEKYENDFKPDLKCYVGNSVLLVEITVTHGIDEAKLQKIQSNNIPLLEIDLSAYGQEITRQKVREALYNVKDLHPRRWVYNPKMTSKEAAFHKRASDLKTFLEKDAKEYRLYGKRRLIYHCPLKGTGQYAPESESYFDTCECCRYKLKVVEKEVAGSDYPDRYIRCAGHRKKEIEDYISTR